MICEIFAYLRLKVHRMFELCLKEQIGFVNKMLMSFFSEF